MDKLKLPRHSPIPLELKEKYFEVPSSPTPWFVGRDDILNNIHDLAAKDVADHHQARIALHGIGGIRKTEIVLGFAFKFQEQYGNIFSIDATSKASINAGFVKLHLVLGFPKDESWEEKVKAVRTRFGRTENVNWMLIFYGADDLEAVELSSYLPVCDHGLVLFTTRGARIRHPRNSTHAVHVDVLTSESFCPTRSVIATGKKSNPTFHAAYYHPQCYVIFL